MLAIAKRGRGCFKRHSRLYLLASSLSAQVQKLQVAKSHSMSHEDGARDSFTDEWAPSADLLHPNMKNQVIVLAGATSVGKSKVAQLLCEHYGNDNCEIIVADSVQVYKHLDIGSNKPSIDERAQVVHHCVDMIEPSEGYSCGEFVRTAVPMIYDILNRGNIPIIVGGSTMWIQWLVRGMPDAPRASENTLKRAAELLCDAEAANDWAAAVAVVAEYAPARAVTINKNDFYRCRRYLEVALQLQEDKDRTISPLTSGGALKQVLRPTTVRIVLTVVVFSICLV